MLIQAVFTNPNMQHLGVDRQRMCWNMLEYFSEIYDWSTQSASLQLSTEISSSFMSTQIYMFFHLEHTQIQLCSNWVLQGSLIMIEAVQQTEWEKNIPSN